MVRTSPSSTSTRNALKSKLAYWLGRNETSDGRNLLLIFVDVGHAISLQEFGYGRFNYFQRQMKVFDKKKIELLSSAFSMTYRLYLLHTSVRIEMDHHGVDGIEDRHR